MTHLGHAVRMTKRSLHVLVGAVAATSLVLGFAAPAQAAQTKRVIIDPVEPANAYDIVKVALKSQKTKAADAKVTVKYAREVQVGDSVDIWFNLDADAQPDLHLVGDSFSEYSVFETTSFATDGKDITKRGCMDLKMASFRSVVRFDPKCLKAGEKFAVSVRSSRSDKPAGTEDYVPSPGKFTKKVLSGPLA